MAELASAVSTLLGVISHEAQRLGRVRRDVQFIQEEVESMSSFLADLSRMGRQHDEQVHTWMNQVRILANDCNSCIDLYLYRGDPAHLPKEGPSRYLWWAPWLLRKLLAQHRAADQLRELKDRARDIGNRRMRYGVEVKKESSAYGAGLTEALLLSATQENEEEDDYQHGGDPLKVALSMTSMWMDKEDYVRRKLEDWIGSVVWREAGAEAANKGIKLSAAGSTEPVARSKPLLPSIAIVVKTDEDADHLRRIVLTVAEDHFKRKKDVQHKAAMPPETKDASSALAHKDKAAVPTETMDAAGTLAHKDMADVPPETKDAGGPLVMKDKAAVPAEIKDASGALTHIDKADVPAKTKDAGNALVFVDVPAVHYNNVPLQLHKLLCYILAELERLQGEASTCRTRWGTYKYTRNTIREIKVKIKEVGIDGKINGIIIRNLMGSKGQLSDLQILDKLEDENDSIKEIGDEALGQLLRLLIYHSTSAAASEKDKKIKSGVAEFYNVIIRQTAKELKRIMEAGGSSSKLQEPEYEDILKTVFPEPTSSSATTVANSPHSTLADDQIQEMAEGVTEMMHDLQGLDKSAKTTVEADFHDTTEKKKEEIIKKIRKQLKVKMMVQKIRKRLEGDQRILVILKVDDKYPPQWEETRNSLSLLELDCPIAGAVFVVTKTTQRDFPCPDLMDRIEYSLVDLYFHTVLQKTGHHMNDEEIRKILHNILCECKSDELCMKIFAHALYAKPKRSREELSKFHSILCTDAAKKSLPSLMLNFSCRELPKEYMSCLLYLTIFPQGQTIRRSTLIGRWVAERLITTRDWRWSDSVDEAEKCFDTLVAWRLVCPAGTGATGKVKSCTVDKLVYGFIAKIAMKQHILDTQLSLHLARHFSIFSDVRLGRYATINDFLLKSSHFSRLKVLDLEGSECFPEYQYYLSDLCRNILMLKYLSLRGTGVTRLPSEINNLHELEVLDIRETYIPASATRNVLLRKLKRLLAGQKLKDLMAQSQSSPADKTEKVEVLCNGKLQNVLRCLSPSHVDSSLADYFSVQIPEKIEKMLGVEVLSNVKPKNSQDLVEISTLNDLKKLGVVINKESDIKPLLNTISDLLYQSLRFLSITLDITIYKNTAADRSLQNHPTDLESLTINGSKKCPEDIKSTSTQMGNLLESLTKYGNQLAKVNLSCTFLTQENLEVLAKLEKLRCVKLRHNAYTQSKLIFNKGEFTNLNNFHVEGNNMTEITFDNGAASNLEKVVLSSTNIVSINGVNCLQKLEELELNNIKNKGMLHSLLVNAKHITRVTLHDTLLEQGDLEILARERKIRYLALLGKFFNGNQLIFKECDFHKLNILIVDSDDITDISFTKWSRNLEKIIWSFRNIDSLSGIDKLPALKELELHGHSVPNEVEEYIKKLESRLDYKHRDMPKIRRKEKRSGW